MGPPIIAKADEAGNVHIVEQESAASRNARARGVVNNVKALIGYFDLDPNRVLDILLDIFASNIVLHWPFFLAVLEASSWGRAASLQTERSSRQNGSAMDVDAKTPEAYFGPVNLDIKTDEGHRKVAQILGFKFGYYQMQDVNDRVPEELYLLAAILIREGNVRFQDLYTHLTPDEKGMTALHEKFKTALSDRASNVSGNALSMAAPLTIDDNEKGDTALSDSKDAFAKKADAPPPKEPPNQVLGLLEALLAIGQLKHALFILGRYPWLCSAFPRVADLYSRLLSVIIEPAYAAISLSTQHSVLARASQPVVRMRYDAKRREMVPMSPPQWRITSTAPEPLSTANNSFAYFFGPWKEALPQCQAGEVLQDFVPLLRILGSNLWRHPSLFQRICRLGKVAMRTAVLRNDDRSGWLEVVRSFLLPTLSMTSGNSGLVSEVWVILRHLPYTERYALYGEWKHALYRRPELRVRQAETEKEAKGILKRISSDNVKLSGRSLAKASHANPTIFFTVALNQVQSYSNLIAPIVECAKYLTHFEYDIFGFNLMDALSNPEKERTKQDGTSVSLWLQSLAAFTGTLYRRYAMMDCSAVLQYIANQLKENNSKDLIIIRELVLKMAGIEPLANLSDAQVAALTGGRLLHMEAMMVANAGITTQARSQMRRSGARLLHALMQSRMAMPLLILIAQQRQACIHLVSNSEAHLKYLGNLFDTCQEVLFQYVEFLHNQLEPQAYAELIPSLEDLCRRFEIEPAIAFHIVRPRLTLRLRAIEAKENEGRLRRELLARKTNGAAKESLTPKAEDGENSPKDGAPPVNEGTEVVDNSTTKASDNPPKDEASEAQDASAAPEVQDVQMDTTESKTKVEDAQIEEIALETKPAIREALEEVSRAADSILPEKVKGVLGVNFYGTFWQLGLSDITVPVERYDQEIKGLQRIIDDNPEVRKVVPKARQQAQDLIKQLRTELKEQTLGHQAVRRRLVLEKDHWFPDGCNRNEVVYQLAQYCLIPRALISPTDAIFAGRLLRLMHTIGARNFASLTAYDRILIEVVGPTTFSATENEARNFARFLQTILADITAWYKDGARYKSEALGENLPGFQMRWANRHGGEDIPQSDRLDHSKFKTVTDKWHNMLRSTFRECLLSREYMRIRNATVIMTRIAPFFPMWETHGIELLDCVSAVATKEERGDLKILGQGLLATLKKEKKNWILSPSSAKKAAAATAAKAEASKAAETTTAKEPEKGALPASDAAKAKEKIAPPPAVNRSASTSDLPKRPPNDAATRQANKAVADAGTPTPTERSKDEARAGSVSDASREAASVPPSSRNASDSQDDSGVAAARQAALASMNQGTMNPPRVPANTSDRHVSSTQRDDARSSVSRRDRERDAAGTSTPRSRDGRSREVSPSAASDHATSARSQHKHGDSRRSSRAGSETSDGKRERPSRDTDRGRRESERDSERGPAKPERQEAHSRRERERSERESARERPSERDRGNARARDDERNMPRQGGREYERSGAAREAGRDADARGPQEDAGWGSRVREDPRADRDRTSTPDRKTLDRNDPRQPSRMSRTHSSSDISSQDRGTRGTPRETIDTRQPTRETREPSGTYTPTRTDNGERDSRGRETEAPASPGTSKKRSLADRLSMSETRASPIESGRNGHAAADDTQGRRGDDSAAAAPSPGDEPNKRARTSRGGRGTGDDRYDVDTRSPLRSERSDRSQYAASDPHGQAQQGISIHGQGRGGGGGGAATAPPYTRRDSQQEGRGYGGAADGRGGRGDARELLGGARGGSVSARTTPDVYRSSAASSVPAHDPRSDRHASGGSGRGDRRGGRDKDQRRRERRSGA